MLCLKTEVLDDQDPTIDTNNASGGSGGGFVLPINLGGGSIHKYLWKMGKVSNRYAASGDGCSSISEFEHIKSLDRRSGQLKGRNVYLYKCHLEEDDITSLDRSGQLNGGTASLYKCQLEEDVKRLQRQLEDEITLRLALATAVEHSDSNFSSSPCQLPDKAFLAYGIPGSDIKLFSLMQKAAYTVGGHSFSAADIEYIILKMKPPAHRPQIALVLALQKFKVTDEQKRYCIDQPEPLLAFALSCGMHSSPSVRIFTPENVNELLQVCLKDYVQASVGISSKGKLLVPKLLSCFAKGIVEDALLPEWICQFLSTEQASLVRDCSTNQKWRLLGSRSFSVVPFDSRFRFLFIL